MARRKSKGLGDTIEKITEATGIKKVVETISELTGVDCGCDERKEKLNKLFPYNKPECLTDNEVEILAPYKAKFPVNISPVEQYKINEIFNRVFKAKEEFTTCGSCLRDRVNKLIYLLDAYQDKL